MQTVNDVLSPSSSRAPTARAGAWLMLATALVAGGASGCGFACNFGLSPCPTVPAETRSSIPAGVRGTCPTEYRPICIEGQQQCTTDANGCTVCDCVSSQQPLRTPDPIDRNTP